LQHPDRLWQLPAGLTPAELAAYLASVGNGLAIRASDGAKREDLFQIIELALAFWPEKADEPTAKKTRPGNTSRS